MEDRPTERPTDLLQTAITRRRLLINGGIVVGGAMLAGPLAACGTANTATNTGGSPRPGGTFRLGVTGGGAKDMIDVQQFMWVTRELT